MPKFLVYKYYGVPVHRDELFKNKDFYLEGYKEYFGDKYSWNPDEFKIQISIQHMNSFNGTTFLTSLKNEERPDDWYLHFMYGYFKSDLVEAEKVEDIVINYPSISDELSSWWDTSIYGALKTLKLPAVAPKFNYIIDEYQPLLGEVD